MAGLTAVAIGRRREVAWALAAVLAVHLVSLHLYLGWSTFPWWYNLGVALPAAPAVLLGGKMGAGFARRATSAVAA